MDIAIVIPAYNAAPFIEKTLESVRAQSETNWECVVVDDGSSDDTSARCEVIARTDCRFRVVQQENGGVARARNRGFSEISSDCRYVIFLDHDDIWTPDCLKTLKVALEADDNAAGAHGLALACTQCDSPVNSADPHVKNRLRKMPVGSMIVAADQKQPTTYKILIWDNVITTTGVILFRRDALDNLGQLFDPEVAPLDDWDIYFRIALQHHIAFVDQVVIHWRLHEANTSNNKNLMNSACCAVRQKMLRVGEKLTPEDRSLIRRRFRRMYRSEFRHSAIDYSEDAKKEMASGHISRALHAAIDSISYYLRYLWLQLYWSENLYSERIPVRAKDAGFAR